MSKNSEKKGPRLDQLLADAALESDQLRERLLLENELKMKEAASRRELAEIADDTLAKLAKLYGESVNSLERELITAVYKPAFVLAGNFDQDQVKLTAKSADLQLPSDGFVFDLFLNEIETLADANLKSRAKQLFYDAIDRIRVGMDRAENYAIADRVSKEIKKMYRDSEHFAHDCVRLEGQLFRAAGQRNQFLKNRDKWQQNQSSEI